MKPKGNGNEFSFKFSAKGSLEEVGTLEYLVERVSENRTAIMWVIIGLASALGLFFVFVAGKVFSK